MHVWGEAYAQVFRVSCVLKDGKGSRCVFAGEDWRLLMASGAAACMSHSGTRSGEHRYRPGSLPLALPTPAERPIEDSGNRSSFARASADRRIAIQ